MACPPPLLESLRKTLSVENNKLTVELDVGTKGKKQPRIVITDLEMLDWLSSKGYNVESVLKSGHVDNLRIEGNESTWEFDVSKIPPAPPPEPPAPKTPRRRTSRQVKPKPPPPRQPAPPPEPPAVKPKPPESPPKATKATKSSKGTKK